MLGESLIWYADNRHKILLYNDQYLALHVITKFVSMRRVTWQERVRHLDRTIVVYEKELKQKVANQNIINKYLHRKRNINGEWI